MHKRHRSPRQSGFTLVAVLIILAVLAVTLAITLQRSRAGLEEGARARAREVVQAAIDHGVGIGLDALQAMEPAKIAALIDRHDIFNHPVANPAAGKPGYVGPFAGPFPYPPAGMFKDELLVTVGVVSGQKTLPPEGEDASKSYGIVMEIQIQVQTNPAVSVHGLMEQRAVVGVQIPHVSSHAGS